VDGVGKHAKEKGKEMYIIITHISHSSTIQDIWRNIKHNKICIRIND